MQATGAIRGGNCCQPLRGRIEISWSIGVSLTDHARNPEAHFSRAMVRVSSLELACVCVGSVILQVSEGFEWMYQVSSYRLHFAAISVQGPGTGACAHTNGP